RLPLHTLPTCCCYAPCALLAAAIECVVNAALKTANAAARRRRITLAISLQSRAAATPSSLKTRLFAAH
ncbi:hypothetical protein Dimus_037550, partial [Dionaea muscipula]